MSRKPAPSFSEIQTFNQPRMRFVLAILPLILTVLLIWQMAFGDKRAESGFSDDEVIVWTIFAWLIYLRLITVKLKTTIFRNSLNIGLTGLWMLRKIPVDKITRAQGIDYDARKEYRGYGIRSNGQDRAYIASGDKGVRLTLIDGASVLVGTQNPVALIKVLGNRRFADEL